MSVGKDDFYLDLLFYHRFLRRLVAIELKLESFQPAHTGQMELYLRWMDKHERVAVFEKENNMSQNQPPSIPPCQGGSLAPSLDKGRAGEGFASDSVFLPYNKNLTAHARENRGNPTKAESKIWREVLRMRQFAVYKFLRQKPIGGYIVDFYCSELRLVIEIDGDSHAETVEYDEERTKLLNSLGLHVIRYTNEEIMQNIEGVHDDLRKRICVEQKEIEP